MPQPALRQWSGFDRQPGGGKLRLYPPRHDSKPEPALCYAGGPTLQFPDVEVAQGAVLLLSGPSGYGKSTWLALVAAPMPRTSGQSRVAGYPVSAMNNIASDA